MSETVSEVDADLRVGGLAARPVILMEDAWLKFELRFYRKRLTLRGSAVSAVSSLIRPRKRKQEQEFWALRGVTLSIDEGEVVGIVGPNGAGKSTLLRLMAGIYSADKGQVRTVGTIATLLSLGAGFDLRRPGRENVYKNGILLGLSRRQIDGCLGEIISTAGIGDFIDAPVMTYSSGMRARLGFAIATNVNPDILLVDEVIAAGDEKFRNRVGNIFDQLSHRKKTVVMVTHMVAALTQYCTRAIWMEQGRVRMDGAPAEVKDAYLAESRREV